MRLQSGLLNTKQNLIALKKGKPQLEAQGQRIHLPMQETQVQSLLREGATKPVHPNCWACALEPRTHSYWVHTLQHLKPACPRANVLPQEKPPPWEAGTLQLERSPLSFPRESPLAATKTRTTKNKWSN